MRSNTARTTKALALGFAGAVALSTMAFAPSAGAAPTDAKVGPVLVKRAPYKCTPTNSVINSITGTQTFLVTTHATIPAKTTASRIQPKNVRLDLILPAKLTKIIREDLNVDKVGGTADAKLDYSSTPGGKKSVAISGLSAPFTKVPKGEMTLPAPGKAGAYKVAGNANKVTIKMPKRFVIHAKLTPPPFGVSKTDLKCVATGAPKTVKVVNVG